MEYHLSIAGERSGPHTQFYIIEGIRDERLKGDELLWHVGLPDWQPLRTVREFEEFWPVSEETRLQAEAARNIARAELDRPRPWMRFWARTLDYLWFSQAFLLVLAPFLPRAASPSAEVPLIGPVWMVVVAILSRLLYVPVEAWLLSRFGSTPGRALLLVQVRRLDGALPTFRQALRRSLQVYIQGIALQLPYVDLIAMLWARMRLLRHGATPWDEANETRVEHGEPETWRFLVLGAVILGVAIINAIAFGSMVEEMSRLPD